MCSFRLCENVETFRGFWLSRVSALAPISPFAFERPSLRGLVLVVGYDGKNGGQYFCVHPQPTHVHDGNVRRR